MSEILQHTEDGVLTITFNREARKNSLNRAMNSQLAEIFRNAAEDKQVRVAVLQGAEKACQAAGYLLVLFNLGNEAGRERDAMHALSAYQLDGMILNRVDTSAQLWQDAQMHANPSCW